MAWTLALGCLYALGYVPGALLTASPAAGGALSWTLVRIVAGLFLSTLGFLLALALGLPWMSGPALVSVAAVAIARRRALALPPLHLRVRPAVAIGTVAGAVLVAPIAVSAARMAPGPHAPVFFNVDTAYYLEQVQALTRVDRYPPASLSNAGGRRAYHYATHGMAALLARISGLRPHTAAFGIVLPLLAAGVLAAAITVAAAAAPEIPPWLAIPALLVPVPSFWYPFWGSLWPMLGEAIAGGGLAPLAAAADNPEFWGVASIVAQNVGAHFLVLAVIAGFLSAPAAGWRFPAVLAGTGILVKVSAGIALLAGFVLATAAQALRARRAAGALPAAAAVAVFLAAFAAFWLLSGLPPEFSTQPFPFFHVARVRDRDGLIGLAADLLWLAAPLLVVALARLRDPEQRTRPLLLFALAPIAIVNATRSIDARPGGGGATDDWLQILLPVPFLMHAAALAYAGARWTRMPAAFRAAFAATLLAAVVPSAAVAARYTLGLLQDPERGHEFVDNAAIAQALAAIPVDGSLIVTNDLRYPAQQFNRDNRQMQIPALFGHQAFAVNYAYEVFAFSRDRFALQDLLRQPDWTDAIPQAARRHGWTHLLVHKPYAYPSPVPLERLFENDRYIVYRFATR